MTQDQVNYILTATSRGLDTLLPDHKTVILSVDLKKINDESFSVNIHGNDDLVNLIEFIKAVISDLDDNQSEILKDLLNKPPKDENES